jgi:hypothetical protein
LGTQPQVWSAQSSLAVHEAPPARQMPALVQSAFEVQLVVSLLRPGPRLPLMVM